MRRGQKQGGGGGCGKRRGKGGVGGGGDGGEDTDVIKLIFPVAILKWPIMVEQEREIVAET